MLLKIISGGQSGVDRAALDAAITNGIDHGGWCPRGRAAEDGVIDDRYLLTETTSADYSVRTRWNVRDSDGTLVLNTGELEGGTALTVQLTKSMNKPLLIFEPDSHSDHGMIKDWMALNRIHILNVAGPRESKQPGIYSKAYKLLDSILNSINTEAHR